MYGADDIATFLDASEFARTANGGSVHGLFLSGYTDGSYHTASGMASRLVVADAAALPQGAELVMDDDGSRYTVRAVQPGGTGTTTLMLELAP